MKAGDGMEMVFPSPIGELHFSILFLYFLIIFFFGFRPLSGSYISQYFAWFNHPFSIVSVPYRGATFLNIYPILSSVFIFEFPSPIGELHFSITHLWTQKKSSMTFPSPIGELHFSIQEDNSMKNFKIVSVPYRGATFLNTIPATPCPVWDE